MSSRLSASSVVRDRLGVHPVYFREDGEAVADSLLELLRAEPERPLRPDREGIARYLAGDPDDRHTCVRGIGLVPAGHALLRATHGEPGWRLDPLAPLPAPHGTLREAMIAAVAAVLAPPRRIAVALSGGLDSALVLAIATRVLGRTPPVVTLAVDVPGYGEREATRRTASVLGVELHELPASARDLLEALPLAVRAAEVPMWNPHPVSKLLLALALRREGFDAVLTGDAADQVFGGVPPRGYLPIVGRLLRSEGVEPCSPFFDARVQAHAARLPPDPGKGVLRALAAEWLPDEIAWAPKVQRLAPDLGVEALVGLEAIERLAVRLGLPPPRLRDANDRCAHTTLCLLWDALTQERSSCAASSA